MIRIDPSFGVGFFFAALLLGVFVVWLISWAGQRKKREDAREMSRLRRCPYCGHTFTDYLVKDIVICPLCKSYLEGKNDI
jgi:protein-arginine kinase activator protein McsA